MEQANITNTFVKYVSLNIFGMIGLSCYILADTFFVARGIGVNGLAALNLVIPIYSFIHGTGLMIGMGGATRFTLSKSKNSFTQALHYAFFAGGFFLLVGLLFSNQLAVLLGANGDTLQNANTYLKTILCFSPLFLLNNVILCFVRNDSNPKLSMMAMLGGSFSNILLDYLFVFPCKMEMFGAALATGIAPAISLLLLSAHFIKGQNTFHLCKQRPRHKDLADISCLGVSALITEFSSGIVIIVFNVILLKLEGNVGVAAYGIIANIALVMVAVFTGISQGMQPLISLCHSLKKQKDAKKILQYGFITSVSIAVLVYIVSLLYADAIVVVFNRDANTQLAEIAANGLRIYFTAFVFVGINILSATYFSSVDNPKNAFIISLLRGFVVILPTTFILSALMGINGVWIAMTFTELLVLLVSAKMLKQMKSA